MMNYRFWKPAPAFLALLLLLTLPGTAPAADRSFNKFAGRWTGGGWLEMSSGDRERIRCRATYFVLDGGNTLNQNLRCASASYTIDAKNIFNSKGGRITGSWSEKTFNNQGKVTGNNSGNNLKLVVTGNDISAQVSVTIKGAKQSVVMSSKSSKIAKLVINLKRG